MTASRMGLILLPSWLFALRAPLAGSHLRSSTFRLFTLTFETSPSYKNEPRISPQLAVNGVILLFPSLRPCS